MKKTGEIKQFIKTSIKDYARVTKNIKGDKK